MAVRPEPALDLTKIDRTIRKEPAYRGKPRYGLLVLGPKAKTRIWLVIDGKTLYVDRNGNGDLTEKGEQFSPTKVNNDQSQYLEFHVGEIVEADRKTKHSGLIVYQYYTHHYDRLVNAAILKDVAGISSQGNSGEYGCSFAATPREAPIIHLNGPLTMRVYRAWVGGSGGRKLYEYSEELKELVDAFPDTKVKPGYRINEVPYRLPAGHRIVELQVQVGTPGLGKGTFGSFPSQTGLLAKLHPRVDVTMPRKDDPKKTLNLTLTLDERCCGTSFLTQVKVPENCGPGKARLLLSFPAWKKGKVAPAVVKLSMIGAPAR
jgi:hypothetical protein